MHVTINDQSLPEDFSHLRNLEEVILELSDKFIPTGQQLFQVRINGEFFTERYPRESRYVSVKDVADLDLKTISDSDMARVILRDAAGQVESLVEALQKSADLFRLAAEDEANHYFAQVLDALRWLMQTGEGACQILEVELSQVQDSHSGDVGEFLVSLQEVLEEMLQVYEEEDYILVADLMEYELLPRVQEWQKILMRLACH
jgi:hypothetical protein